MPSHFGTHRSFLTTGTAAAPTIPVLPTVSLSPVLHLDASNAGSLTVSGGLISAWTDLITGTYQFTATTTKRPTLVSSVYGSFSLPTVRFDGAANYLTGNSVLAAMNDAGGHTLVLIMLNTTGTGGCMFGNNATSALLTGFEVVVTSGPAWDYVTGDGLAAHGLTKSLTNGTLYFLAGVEDNAGSGVIPGSKKQGLYVNSNTLAASGTNGYTAQSILAPTIGGANYTLGTHLVTGDVCEVIGYGGPLNNADINDLHFYSRVKWGTL